jgi:hypothetical protein
MIPDVRVFPLNERPHLPPALRQCLGDSRGHWEGTTLVVDTTNFNDKTEFHGASEGLHLIERFTRVDDRTLDYTLTIQDPTTFTRPWTIAFPAMKADGPIYEYACHEGNYAMTNALAGSRAAEKRLSGTSSPR